jgi:drug/metabolite transporter (DMT)-like permease
MFEFGLGGRPQEAETIADLRPRLCAPSACPSREDSNFAQCCEGTSLDAGTCCRFMNTHPLRGALLCVAALVLFACMDTAMKLLTATLSVPLIVAARYIVSLLVVVLVAAPGNGLTLAQTQRPGLVLARAGFLCGASLFVGLAFARMPVAETTAINFLAPILVVLAAGPFLRENVGWTGWAAAILGIAGVLLIARPGSGLSGSGVAFALAAATSNAGYQLLSRVLAGTERTMTLLFYVNLIGAVLFGLAAPLFWQARLPNPVEIALLLSLGVLAAAGHFLFTAAFRYAPASLLSPMTYLQVPLVTLLGWLVFKHVPDAITLAGMLVIVVSGAFALRSGRTA